MEENLTNLNIGETAVVRSLLSEGSIRRRLYDLGITENSKITCELKRRSGQIAAYRIRGALIALRDEDARNIIICREVNFDE